MEKKVIIIPPGAVKPNLVKAVRLPHRAIGMISQYTSVAPLKLLNRQFRDFAQAHPDLVDVGLHTVVTTSIYRCPASGKLKSALLRSLDCGSSWSLCVPWESAFVGSGREYLQAQAREYADSEVKWYWNVSASPTKKTMLLVTEQCVYLSQDFGTRWTAPEWAVDMMAHGEKIIPYLRCINADGSRIVIAVRTQSTGDKLWFTSADAGESWSWFSDGLEQSAGFVKQIAFSSDSDCLYMLT
jgi:hypothetical protein